MWGHLSEADLIDAVEGEPGAPVRAHLEACVRCQARLAEAGEGFALAREAAEVPEPPGLYWESFPRQVARRLEAEPAPRSGMVRLWPAFAAAAAVMTVLAVTPRPVVAPVAAPPEATLAAWTPLPAAEEDAGLAVLEAIGPTLADAGVPPCEMAECLADLSEEESRALVDALRSELKGDS